MTDAAHSGGIAGPAPASASQPKARSPWFEAWLVFRQNRAALIGLTLLSLIVIPVGYTYVDDFAQWLHRCFRRVGKTADAGLAKDTAS